MRGKDLEVVPRTQRPGITPAYAGKRPVSWLMAKPARDHPRVCGEKSLKRCNPASPLGSPPRMRGKVREEVIPMWEFRITPAYAGKSEGGGDTHVGV